jgi:hypothetical protein
MILKKRACLLDFGPLPFQVPLYLETLRARSESPNMDAPSTTTHLNTHHRLSINSTQHHDQVMQLELDTINILNAVENDVQEHAKLRPLPSTIADCFSVVTCDPFHHMEWMVVPNNHEINKEFHNRLTRGWFEFGPIQLGGMKENLYQTHSPTNEKIEIKMIFDLKYFQKRFPRVTLPPSKHCWRVQPVCSWYGAHMSESLGKPMFNYLA